MPTYVTLYKLTDQGAKDIKGAPSRIQAGLKEWERLGGKTIGFYIVEGEYDYVSITEAPDEMLAGSFTQSILAQGNVRTKTLRAFSPEQFTSMIAKMK